MRVVSLFSGAGGLDFGFVMAGHEIIWANDCYGDAVETYRLNIGSHIVQSDIADISSDAIPDCDIVIGGFPCQGFSVANIKRSVTDERNSLYRQLVRVISWKRPKFFLAENVKGLISLARGRVFEMILNDFKDLRYRVSYKVLNAADFGVPQELWYIRELYVSLITDFDILRLEEIQIKRDKLTEKTNNVNKTYPGTDAKSYEEARKALQQQEEQTFNKGEAEKILNLKTNSCFNEKDAQSSNMQK